MIHPIFFQVIILSHPETNLIAIGNWLIAKGWQTTDKVTLYLMLFLRFFTEFSCIIHFKIIFILLLTKFNKRWKIFVYFLHSRFGEKNEALVRNSLKLLRFFTTNLLSYCAILLVSFLGHTNFKCNFFNIFTAFKLLIK